MSASQLTQGAEPRPIFKKDQKVLAVMPALDQIERRFGQQAWTRASLLPVEIKTRASGFCYDHEI